MKEKERLELKDGLSLIMDDNNLDLDAMIDIGDNMNIDAGVIMVKKKSIMGKILKEFGVFLLCAMVLSLIIFGAFASQFRIIQSDKKITGTTYEFHGFQIIPADYQISLQDIREGSYVIYKDGSGSGFFGPLLLSRNQKIAKVEKIKNTMQIQIYREENKHDLHQPVLNVFDIMYVFEGK